MSKVKWGVLGCADIAEKAVIPAINRDENSKFYAVASRSIDKAKSFAEKFEAEKFYGDYQALLEDDSVQAVYIPLPNALHKKWTIKAARNKKDILCEKPLSINYGEACEMVKTAEEEEVMLMEGFMYRFHPLTHKIKEIVNSGQLGKIKHINVNFSFKLSESDSDYLLDKELGGGALYDIGCYCVNFTRYLAGSEPIEVYNTFVKRPGTEVDNRGLAALKFPGDILANLSYSFSFYDHRSVDVIGENGKILIPDMFEINDEDKTIYLEKDGDIEEIRVKGQNYYHPEIEAFSEAVLKGKKAPLNIRDACSNMKVIDAMFESDASGKAVELKSNK